MRYNAHIHLQRMTSFIHDALPSSASCLPGISHDTNSQYPKYAIFPTQLDLLSLSLSLLILMSRRTSVQVWAVCTVHKAW